MADLRPAAIIVIVIVLPFAFILYNKQLKNKMGITHAYLLNVFGKNYIFYWFKFLQNQNGNA